MKKVRLDQLVFERGFTESRERAKTTVMSGLVYVNGQKADKPGMPVDPEVKLEVRGDALPFVSRGGYKLDKALAWKLRSDERVVNLERTNLRYITREQIPEELDLAVMDVSFISIRLVLPAVKELLKPGADYICLIKPQFEAGREEVGKKGVVRDPAVHEEVVRGILEFAPTIGFSVLGLDYSPIRGPEGNIEYICWLKKGQYEAAVPDPAAVVKASHEAF